MADAEARSSDALVFFVNGRKVVDTKVDPEWTLLEYLRERLCLRGTKLACGEGGCGACTVMVSWVNARTGKLQHDSVNACLAPICSMHLKAVTTVEGIGSVKTQLHAVQERIALSHGSQCGFCTPGIVMSMYTLLRNNPTPSMEEIDVYMQGNLCRCTGYRPILDAWKTFSPGSGCCGGSKNGKCCKDISNGEAVEDPSSKDGEYLCNLRDGDGTQLFDPSQFRPYDATQEPIFPPELAAAAESVKESVTFVGPRVVWFQPATIEELVEIKEEHPEAKIIVGNTELGVEVKIKKQFYQFFINPINVKELRTVSETTTGLQAGAAVTMTELEEELKKQIQKRGERSTQAFSAVLEILNWFSGKQIRNVAALGGNIATASPISDLNPLLVAAGASVILRSRAGSRHVPLNGNFFTGYRRHQIKPDEVVVSIHIPFTKVNEYFKGFKQARRREDDIAIVNAGMRVRLDREDKVEDMCLAFGGMAEKTVEAPDTVRALIGRKWSEVLEGGFDMLFDDLPLSPSAPGGMVSFRKVLALSFFHKFWISVSHQLNRDGHFGSELQGTKSSLQALSRGLPTASQIFSIVPDGQPTYDAIGRPLVHRSAFEQTTGEARYCDDTPRLENEAHIAFVFSTRAKAKIVKLDPKATLAMDGVIGFLSADDVRPGGLAYGVAVQDDQVFWSDYVTSRGQVVAAVCAETARQAREGAQAVVVEYEDDGEAVISIQDAIKAQSYYWTNSFGQGDVERGLRESAFTAKGTMYVGGQEHFYLEPQTCLVIPKGEHNEIEAIISIQDVKSAQLCIAHVLGIPANRVVVRTKRIGGGFGGKEFRSNLYAVPAALAAAKFQRPIRCVMDRDEDMISSGQRHAFYCEFEVGCDSKGKLMAVDLKLYNNAGYSTDLSIAVMEKGMWECTNAYEAPNIRVQGHVCKTNIVSNTAFRGFGAIQCMLIAETWITRLAEAAGLDPHQVRETNFVRDGSVTHFGQEIRHCTLQRCWAECLQRSDYAARLRDVSEFNRVNTFKKRGIAVTPTKYGIGFMPNFLNQGYALVHAYLDGSVLLSHGGVEMGQGLHTKMIQVASRALRIPVSLIHTLDVSTDRTPNTTTTAASVGADLNGGAVQNACEKLLQRLEPFIAENPKGSWQDWVKAAYFGRVSLSAAGHFKPSGDVTFSWDAKRGNVFNYFCYGAACSEVEVDCLTGDHRAIRTDLVMDVGESLNPAIDIGQVEGAFVQGYGLYTMEEPVYGADGTIRSNGPGMYKIPGFGDIPETLNVSLLRGSPNKHAVYSSKAVGEPPLFLASSVFFAIRNAIKAYRESNGEKEPFILYSPATAERIRMACSDGITKKIEEKESVPSSSFTPWMIRI